MKMNLILLSVISLLTESNAISLERMNSSEQAVMMQETDIKINNLQNEMK